MACKTENKKQHKQHKQHRGTVLLCCLAQRDGSFVLKFIVCTDAGLSSTENHKFNNQKYKKELDITHYLKNPKTLECLYH